MRAPRDGRTSRTGRTARLSAVLTVLSVEHSERGKGRLAPNYPIRVVLAAMARPNPDQSNLIGGGNAPAADQWVSWVGGCRGRRNLFRLGGSMLAFRFVQAARIGGHGGAFRSASENGGFPPFPGHRAGYVAWPHVAWSAQGAVKARFLVRRRLIANLTTPRRARFIGQLGRADRAGHAGGASPLSALASVPQAPALRRDEVQKNLRSRPLEPESLPGAEMAAKFNWQMGSGVRAASTRDDLPREGRGIRTERTGLGVGEHCPLDAGKLWTLCPTPAGVNVA